MKHPSSGNGIERALLLRPAGHPDRASLFDNLARAQCRRFDERGEGNGLGEAIKHHQTCALRCRFKKQGDEKGLDEAIRHHQSALLLRSIGHPGRSSSLNNLARGLRCRFEKLGDGKDLDEAVKNLERGLLLRPAGRPDHHSTTLGLHCAAASMTKKKAPGRIWWCPISIFTAFPLHVAGEYRAGESTFSQIYVSYTPTLMALVRARKIARTGSSSPISFAAIGQAQPGGQWASLPFVEQELDSVECFVPMTSATLTKLTSSLSTREAASWVLQNDR
ncbi:hypothetical protein BDN67DRAFT_1015970 [Paxillus ammoniavirescens]|nr:hypothetical protein BDN67DRAFT_1015970 [Paxillus ammoniavirescens]